MSGRIILGIANPALDSDGHVAAGTTLTFYQNLTTTPQTVYSAADLLTPLTNPLTCDAAGRFPMIWAPASTTYSVKLSIPGEAPITYDNIYVTSANAFTSSTQQYLNSGTSLTYHTPVGCRRIRIRMKAGGGGGAASGTIGLTVGANGTDTVFNAVHAAAGIGATSSSGTIGGQSGVGVANFRLPGAPGQGARFGIVGTTYMWAGGNGGGNGGGVDALGSGGISAGSNSGGGGGGGGFTGTGTFSSLNSLAWTAGGSEGEYVELIIYNPAATYTYTVGQGGIGGTTSGGGSNGGSGGSGWILVDEDY